MLRFRFGDELSGSCMEEEWRASEDCDAAHKHALSYRLSPGAVGLPSEEKAYHKPFHNVLAGSHRMELLLGVRKEILAGSLHFEK